jgi:hypothetical protein
VFSSAGLAILIFTFASNYSSINYYYEKGLLKQYGQEDQAEINNKHSEDFNSKAFENLQTLPASSSVVIR